MKQKVYLDHNVIICANENQEVFQHIISTKKQYTYFYSPAHIEEIFKKYKASCINNSQGKVKLEKCSFKDDSLKNLVMLWLRLTGYSIKGNIDYIISLMKCIELITGKKDILPNFTSYRNPNWHITESTFECFGRVSRCDTTQAISLKGHEIYEEGKKTQSERKNDKTVTNISTLNKEEIWSNHYISDAIANFNKYEIDNKIHRINQEIQERNQKLEETQNKQVGIRDGFKIKKDICASNKVSRVELELIMETLFEILNSNGYRREKKEETSISSIHDVSHALYGSYCDKFITTDNNFFKKLEAVYWYTGIKTEVYYCKQEGIEENIKGVLVLENNMD